jgi:hypothetical protein
VKTSETEQLPQYVMTPLAAKAMEIARSLLGVREVDGSNRGPDVERFLRRVGCRPGDAWCAAFVTDVVYEGEQQVGGPAQFTGSPSALKLLVLNAQLRLRSPEPGCVFVIDHGKGKGHCGFVVEVLPGGLLRTIEGNTGPGPAIPEEDHDGQGGLERTDHHVADCCGFIRVA